MCMHGRAWRDLLKIEPPIASPTIAMLAERVVVLRPSLKRNTLVLVAERAVFMFHNQVAILEDEEDRCYLVVEPIPAFERRAARKCF